MATGRHVRSRYTAEQPTNSDAPRFRFPPTANGAPLLLAGAAAVLVAAIGGLAAPDNGNANAQTLALATPAGVSQTAAQVTPLSEDLLELRNASRAASREAERRALEEQKKKEEAERKAAEDKKKAAEEKKKKEEAARQAALKKQYSLPVSDYRLTGRFGNSGKRWARTHTGLDFAAAAGTPVKSVAAGRVISAGWAGAYGNRIIVRHADGTHTWYCHLSKFVKTGGKVAVGQTIGKVGSTGNSTGPHLHLEVRPGGGSPVDPEKWLAKRGHRP